MTRDFSRSPIDTLLELNLLRAFLTFGLVGAVGTACHYATLISLVELLAVDPVVATSAGFMVGMVVNYALNYRYSAFN